MVNNQNDGGEETIPVVADGTDQSALINSYLANSSASVLRLPAGDFWIGDYIIIPAGKTLVGAGQDQTILHLLDTFDPGVDNRTIQIGDGAGLADLTLDGEKVNLGEGTHERLHGVVGVGVGFHVDHVSVVDITGYAFWGYAGGLSDATKPPASGVFSDCYAENANVLFETSDADGILFERCVAADGDGDVPKGSAFHPAAGSNNISFVDCSYEGGGPSVDVLANAGDQTGILFLRVHGTTTGTAGAFYVAGTGRNQVTVIDSHFVSQTDPALYLYQGDLVAVNSSFEGSRIGVAVDSQSSAHFTDSQVTATGSPGYSGLTWGIYSEGKVLWEGGSITASASPGSAGAYAGNVEVVGASVSIQGVQQSTAPTWNVVAGTAAADILHGTANNDIVYSSAVSPSFARPFSAGLYVAPLLDTAAVVDSLFGEAGDDRIFAGYSDIVDGGAGNDTLLISFEGATTGIVADFRGAVGGAAVTIGGATISGIEKLEWLEGSEQDDLLAIAENSVNYAPIFGRGGDDHIIGGRYTGSLFGGDGNDLIELAADAQFSFDHFGEAGNDHIVGGGAGDRLFGGIGADRLEGKAGNDFIDGGTGNDIVEGGDGNDALVGGAGNDVFLGGSGVDSFNGGADDGAFTDGSPGYGDRVDFSDPGARWGVIADLRNGLISNDGFAKRESMTGIESLGADTAFADTLRGNDSINFLSAGLGDTLYGFGGNDMLQLSAAAAIADGGSGTDVLDLSSTLPGYRRDSNGDGLAERAPAMTSGWVVGLASGTLQDGYGNVGTVANIENAVGSAFADTLVGNDQANRLEGGGGNDVIAGGAGDDQLVGGLGNDVYTVDGSDMVIEAANAGTDEIRTSLAAYTLAANVEKLTGTSAAGQTLTGNGLANVISGGDGNDVIAGGSGADQLVGGAGNDVYTMDTSDTIVEATNGGIDEVRTAIAAYTLGANLEYLTGTSSAGQSLTGNGISNTLNGGGGNDVLDGGVGNDTLNGGNGADQLVGGTGADSVQGNAGADVFRYDAASDSTPGAPDLIGDFQAGVDKIDLSRIDANTLTAGDQAFHWIGSDAFSGAGAASAGELRTYQSGSFWWVAGDTNGDGTADLVIALTPQAGMPLTAPDFLM
jgi:Ca2+-binding RTX toxin-like protein